ncbi:hypothetical protein HPB47_000108 [Ixodes persulcatus]|uniref:Uncharacterized protein n=1 Tax=Ixodes persulcatus TaxID=34615 RepID=A0AC60PSM5_IXOPE|nr:hypothetical protein HPB47_000108 [Ixodes persulcatus]
MTWNVNVLFSYSIKSLSTGKGVITLGMPSSLIPSQQSEAKISLYEKLIVSLAFLLGRKNDYNDLARSLISIERDIAKFRNESKVSTAFNVRDLGNLCADFPWQKWMLALNKNLPARIALTPQKSIIVHHPSYIGRLLTYFLNHDSPENINAYLALHVLLKYGQVTYDIRHVQEIVIYMGKDVPARHIMNTCQQWMSTLMLDAWNTFVSQALTRPEEIESLSQLVTNIKRVFVDRIRRLSWMDARTRNISIQKASNIALNIPRVTDHTSSSNKSSVTLPDLQGDFLDMVCTIVGAISNDEDLSIGQVIDRSDSVTVHSNVNAVYTYSLNVVNINAALLVVPFYTDGLPVPLNYGGIGTIVAHEIIHGFDASGRLYDDIGEFEDWWSNETSSTYREISACFQEQMQALSPRSGSVTLEENLADNGGVRCAFDAYVFAATQDRRVVQLKGLDSFEEDQLFFLNYCYKFCGCPFYTGCLLGETAPGGHTQEAHRTGQAPGRPPREASTPMMAERRSGPTPPGLRRYREPGSRQACAARGRAVRSNIAAPGRAVRDGTPAPRSGSVYDGGPAWSRPPCHTVATWTAWEEGGAVHFLSRRRWKHQPRPTPGQPDHQVPLPFRGHTQPAAPRVLGAPDTCWLCGVPIIHLKTHEAGRLHTELLEAQPLPDNVAAAVQTLRASCPDLLAPAALASVQPARPPENRAAAPAAAAPAIEPATTTAPTTSATTTSSGPSHRASVVHQPPPSPSTSDDAIMAEVEQLLGQYQ